MHTYIIAMQHYKVHFTIEINHQANFSLFKLSTNVNDFTFFKSTAIYLHIFRLILRWIWWYMVNYRNSLNLNPHSFIH